MNEKDYEGDVLIGHGKYDWVSGGNSAIIRKELVPNMDWKPYAGEQEIQFLYEYLYDTLFCVSFSACSNIARFFMYYLSNNLMPAGDVLWLKDPVVDGVHYPSYFKNGFINFNERYVALNGGTTNKGAYQYAVGNGIRDFGLIPQSMFPYADNFNDNISHKFITNEMFALGKEFNKRFSINYEWVYNIDEALKYGPVQAVVRFANYEKPEDILSPNGETNHCIEIIFSTNSYYEIDDTYNQQIKRYAKDKVHSFLAYSLTINKNNMDVAKFLRDNDKKQVRNTITGAYGVIYRGQLFVINQDRAGLYMIDRDARGLLGKLSTVNVNQSEWDALNSGVNF